MAGQNLLRIIFSIEELIKFLRDTEKGRPLVAEYLLTFGVKPAQPHPGYGYIKPGVPLGAGYRVAEFKEKPDEKTALAYVEKGYLWNSGMFLFHTGVFTEEVRRCCPEVAEAFRAEDLSEIFEKVPAISIDYGVMEKSGRVAVVPLSVLSQYAQGAGNVKILFDDIERQSKNPVKNIFS